MKYNSEVRQESFISKELFVLQKNMNMKFMTNKHTNVAT